MQLAVIQTVSTVDIHDSPKYTLAISKIIRKVGGGGAVWFTV